MATLRHLCMFHKLKCVDIVTEMSIVLDDDALRDLVMSWPRLETMKLISNSDAGDPLRQQTRATLRGLVHIVQYCPSLGSLGIHVDTSESDILVGPATPLLPDAPHCNSRIQRVSFSRSLLLGDPAMIGAFLLAIFPNLTHIALGWSEYDELEEWEPVCDAMQALRMESQKEDELSTTPTDA
ncbi:hypothetical protein FOMPIDRAFT_1049658 [Fomitopsis schrenkii]|uniref:F-box domain-containing protein n=1 Tax=Fomitopsis schrenkii TaxID=2126942 RepID=S8E6Q4_FOMSC|nr:hypothetical protein FOMPIDRAFT_1049658 [Fomitopsis schrenkii]